MRSRAARVIFGALLLVVAIAAALQFTFALDQARQLQATHVALLTQLARFDATAADLAAAQAAYVAPGQPDLPWTDRVTQLSGQLTDALAALGAAARSTTAASQLHTMRDAVDRLAAADAAAREQLRQENDLGAADVVFNEASEAMASARKAAAELGEAERTAFAAADISVRQRLMIVPGAAAALLLIGVALLVPRPRAHATATVDQAPAREPEPPAIEPANPAGSGVDLTAVADLCADLSRVTSSAALPDMLARAAALLDASGIIVWMASGGELFAATAHGYNPNVIRRLGAIPRDADNATADAWRTGELRTVASDSMSNGAIVAPMFGPGSCIGVLAAEVRHGREQDAATQAVTMMVAAQLAAVLGAWPASAARVAEA